MIYYRCLQLSPSCLPNSNIYSCTGSKRIAFPLEDFCPANGSKQTGCTPYNLLPPEVDWLQLRKRLVKEKLGHTWSAMSTPLKLLKSGCVFNAVVVQD